MAPVSLIWSRWPNSCSKTGMGERFSSRIRYMQIHPRIPSGMKTAVVSPFKLSCWASKSRTSIGWLRRRHFLCVAENLIHHLKYHVGMLLRQGRRVRWPKLIGKLIQRLDTGDNSKFTVHVQYPLSIPNNGILSVEHVTCSGHMRRTQ